MSSRPQALLCLCSSFHPVWPHTFFLYSGIQNLLSLLLSLVDCYSPRHLVLVVVAFLLVPDPVAGSLVLLFVFDLLAVAVVVVVVLLFLFLFCWSCSSCSS